MGLRADSDRVTHPLFHAGEGGSTPTSALSLWFFPCDRETFARLNLAWHSRLPRIGASQGRVYYAAEYDHRIYAVAMWSNPVARMLPQKEWLELRRFAIAPDAPRNSASSMLGWMVRDIRARFPEVVRLISYQDCDVHAGTIYKAAGWCRAENYVSRPAKVGWASRYRAGRTKQPMSTRMRWEYRIRKSGEEGDDHG